MPNQYLTKVQKQFNGGKITFFKKWCWSMDIHRQKQKQPTLTYLTFYTKVNSQWIMNLNYKTQD